MVNICVINSRLVLLNLIFWSFIAPSCRLIFLLFSFLSSYKMAYKQRWLEFFDLMDANDNGFIEPGDAAVMAKVNRIYSPYGAHNIQTLSEFLRLPPNHEKVQLGVQRNNALYPMLLIDY